MSRSDSQSRFTGRDTPLDVVIAGADFPNLFTITGPGSPSVSNNMLPTIEQHVDRIMDLLDDARMRGRPTPARDTRVRC